MQSVLGGLHSVPTVNLKLTGCEAAFDSLIILSILALTMSLIATSPLRLTGALADSSEYMAFAVSEVFALRKPFTVESIILIAPSLAALAVFFIESESEPCAVNVPTVLGTILVDVFVVFSCANTEETWLPTIMPTPDNINSIIRIETNFGIFM